jgi:hypothetical protein
MHIFLAKQLAFHPFINGQQITKTNGKTLHPFHQNFGPSTSQKRQQTGTSSNSQEQQQVYPIIKSLTNI